MNLASIPAGVPFLDTLAALWRERANTNGLPLHDGLILLPTRRAARALAAAFLRGAGEQAILLPRIVALSGVDEAPLALAGALTLPPAIGALNRLAILARLILAKGGAGGAPRHADGAWRLAAELALLMDEAERAEIDLLEGLRRAADPVHAMHWDQTLRFLEIVTEAWPAHLAEMGLINPAARQIRLLDAQAAAWRDSPPGFSVLAVGNAGDIPAVGRLLRVVAGLPHGLVVLPGLDTELPDAVWQSLDEAHPQSGLRDLLVQLDARRGDVVEFGASRVPERAALLRRALLPASALGEWQNPLMPQQHGMRLLTAADAQDEAVGIALILRDALQTPDAVAALVTPDRALAERVTAELQRFGVVADDSAGEKLARTPPAVFLRLLAEAVTDALSPVKLLALLKHPFAAAGLAPAEARRRARLLEMACLRGPRPDPGLAGLRRAIDRRLADPHPRGFTEAHHADVTDLLARLETCLEPMLRVFSAPVRPPVDMLIALAGAAEALAATDAAAGPAVLWALEEGEALAQLLAEALEALPALPEDAPSCLPGLLEALLEGAVVRSRRATRGRGGVEHPRIFIWGLLEARLQSADVLVLGGLSDGVWPPATDPGPWMSRPMRARARLPSPELRVGQAAHDFCMYACAAPVVVLSAPRRRDQAPAVPSRWLTRLEAMLRGHGGLPAHPASGWTAALDRPLDGVAPVAAPQPRPPVALRPRRLNVTEVAVLMADPYAIYARRILKLDRLDPIEYAAEFRDYGNIVHAGLDGFLRAAGLDWPADAKARLAAALRGALRAAGVREALIAWWSPRLERIADWVDGEERRRRDSNPPVAIATETKGEWVLERAGGPFLLTGRADRLERGRDGRLTIIDYKTGTLPSQKDVELGLAPQLLLEAAMAREGRFGEAFQTSDAELLYWRLSGGHKAGEILSLYKGDRVKVERNAGEAVWHLIELIDRYDDVGTAYPSQAAGGRASDYTQLARVAEWGAAGDDDDAEADEFADAEGGA